MSCRAIRLSRSALATRIGDVVRQLCIRRAGGYTGRADLAIGRLADAFGQCLDRVLGGAVDVCSGEFALGLRPLTAKAGNV